MRKLLRIFIAVLPFERYAWHKIQMFSYFTFCMIQRVFLDFSGIYVKIIVYSLTIGVCLCITLLSIRKAEKAKV